MFFFGRRRRERRRLERKQPPVHTARKMMRLCVHLSLSYLIFVSHSCVKYLFSFLLSHQGVVCFFRTKILVVSPFAFAFFRQKQCEWKTPQIRVFFSFRNVILKVVKVVAYFLCLIINGGVVAFYARRKRTNAPSFLRRERERESFVLLLCRSFCDF